MSEIFKALPQAGFLFFIREVAAYPFYYLRSCMRHVASSLPGFCCACLLIFILSAYSQEPVASDPCQRQPTASFALRAGGGWRSYAGVFAGEWNPYPYAGATLDLPTVSRNFFFRISGDGGMVTGRISSVPERLLTLRESFSGVVEVGRFERVVIRSSLGVSSATFFFSPSFEFNAKPFTTSESEFGIGAGLEAAWRAAWFELMLPLSFDWIFSLPHPLLILSAGLQAGGVF